MRIRIVPNDTLFFRDGKPFSLGDETWADGIFPPFPSTLYGSLRTKYIAEKRDGYKEFCNENMKNIIGTKHRIPENGFKMNTIYLGYSDKSTASLDRYFFPTPIDMARYKEHRNDLLLLKPKSIKELTSSSPLPQVLTIEGVEEELESADSTFIQDIAFYQRYFLGFYENINFIDIENILQEEPKVGIGRSDFTHTSEESRLYRVGMSRMNFGWSLYAEIEGIESNDLFSDENQSTIIKLGGEGKTAKIFSVQEKEAEIREDIDELNKLINEDKRFKIYFMTPAIFKNGWYPDFVTNSKDYYLKDFPEFKLKTAAVGKPIHIGGWDMGKKCPKNMMRAIPAGSVYFFSAKKEAEIDIDEIINHFHRKNHSIRKEEGFGFCLMTIWR